MATLAEQIKTLLQHAYQSLPKNVCDTWHGVSARDLVSMLSSRAKYHKSEINKQLYTMLQQGVVSRYVDASRASTPYWRLSLDNGPKFEHRIVTGSSQS